MKIKLSELRNQAVLVFVKSPVEIIMSFMFLLYGLWVTWFSDPYFGSPLYNLKFYFFACVGLTYTMNIAFQSGRKRIIYYISLLSPLVAFLYLSYGSKSDLSLIVTTLCVIILMFIASGWRDNRKFTRTAIARSLNLFLSGVLSGIAMLALMAVYGSFVFIFNLESADDKAFLTILDFGMYAFFPLLFLLFEYNEKYEITRNRFSEILFNYILTPAIVLFGVIIYIYFAKIIVLWELPKGGVAAVAIAFLAGGIIVQACMSTLNKHIWNWFFNNFRFIALLVLGMLWVAVMCRVMEYGFTDKRVYLMVSVVVLTVWIFAQFFKRTNVYLYLSGFTAFLFLAFTYIPFVNADALQKRTVVNVVERRAENFRIWGGSSAVDISGYTNIVVGYGYIVSDTLSVYSDENRELLFEISGSELLDNVIEGYQELSVDDIKRVKRPLVYRSDRFLLIFDSIDLSFSDKKYTLVDANIRSIITK